MATSNWHSGQPRLLGKANQVCRIQDIPEGSTQSFKAGMPVKLSSGKVVIATDGTTGMVGIAMEAASGTVSTGRAVQIAEPDSCYVIAQTSSAGTLTSASGGTIGTTYDFYYNSSTGLFTVDLAATSGPILTFVDYIRDVNGDSTYWGIFEVLAGQAGNIDASAA